MEVHMDIFETRQRKIIWKQVLLVLILGVCLLGMVPAAGCGGLQIVTVTENYTIEAGQKQAISILLEKNDRLDLCVIVASDDIGITLDDPNGRPTIPFHRIESGNFVLVAKEDGAYVVTLDNSDSPSTPKSVTLICKVF
jgi:hypothetical protein